MSGSKLPSSPYIMPNHTKHMVNYVINYISNVTDSDITMSIEGIASESDNEYEEFLRNFVELDRVNSPIGKSGTLVRKTILEDFIKYKGAVIGNWPVVSGFPITFSLDDEVTTRDERKGICVGSLWTPNLVNYRNFRTGYFVVKVDFSGDYEYHIRNDLVGDRIKSRDPIEGRSY